MSCGTTETCPDFNTLTDAMVHWAKAKANRTALTFLSGDAASPITYADLHHGALAVAGALETQCHRGDRVILGYEQSVNYVVGFLACVYSGRVAVTSSPPTELRRSTRLANLLDDSGATVILTDDDAVDKFAEVGDQVCLLNSDRLNAAPLASPIEPEFDELMFLQYTSGSTSEPKGVMLSHGSIAANLHAIMSDTRPDANSVYVSWLPLYHDMGLIFMTLAPLFAGRPMHLMTPSEFLRKPERWLQAISRYHGTITAAPNFAYRLCVERIRGRVKDELDLSSMAYFINGSEPIRIEDMEMFQKHFSGNGVTRKAIFGGYGMAELGVYACLGSMLDRPSNFDGAALEATGKALPATLATVTTKRLAACGRTNPQHFDLRIVDPDSCEECSPGQAGEVWISGASVAQGYWQNLPATMVSFKGKIIGKPGTYMRTGDIAFLHDEHLYIFGRIKEMMIIRGRNIFPSEVCHIVENIGPSMRGRRAAAFAIPGDADEEMIIVCAARSPNIGTCEAISRQIVAAVSGELGVIPSDIIFVQNRALSRTTSGKVQHAAIRKIYLEGRLDYDFSLKADAQSDQSIADSPETRLVEAPNWMTDRICAYFTDISGQRALPDRDLFELGLDSLRAIRLIEAIEADLLGRKSGLLLSDIVDLRTPRRIAALLASELSTAATARELVL